MSKTKTFVLIFFALAALALGHPVAAQACPGCNNALNGDLGLGFNTSILFMMAMPFTVVGCVAAGIVLLHRKISPTQATSKRELQNTKESGN
jgi:hypothetical protein